MDVVGCGVYLKEFCEEDLLTKDNLKTSLCFVFYLSLDPQCCDVWFVLTKDHKKK